MTDGECIYRKTVDYMSRMALEKDDFVIGNWAEASRLEIGL